MKKYLLALVLAAAAVAVFMPGLNAELARMTPEEKDGWNKSRIVTANNEFAVDLYGKLASQPGNLFLSPYSISAALTMTYAGARGRTEQQMAYTLGFLDKFGHDFNNGNVMVKVQDVRSFPSGEELYSLFGWLADAIKPSKPATCQLNIANALWGQTGYKFRPEFLGVCKNNFRSEFNQLDFVKQTEQARLAINDWAAKQTQDKIKDLLQKGMVTPATALVLTNAIYFKGNWQTQFDKTKTVEADFTLADGKKVKTPMMELSRGKDGVLLEVPYLETDDMQMVRLPYVGDELSMLVILPRKPDGLAALEKGLKAEGLNKWVASFSNKRVFVCLPKFKMTSTFALKDQLSAMGMSDAFEYGKADFSGMDGTKELFISAVIHKAFVDVNEEGTEAAAATAVIMKVGAAPSEPPTFRADRPFIFVIRDMRTGTTLFMGRVADPTKG
ncbi:MAG: serpin family protein [Candidatus Brocadiia bacterium]